MAETGSEFSNTSGLIALDNVQCGTGDDNILECFSSPLLSYNCTQNNLAGVRCEGEEVTSYSMITLFSHSLTDCAHINQSHAQLLVRMANCGWQGATFQMKVAWRCV